MFEGTSTFVGVLSFCADKEAEAEERVPVQFEFLRNSFQGREPGRFSLILLEKNFFRISLENSQKIITFVMPK